MHPFPSAAADAVGCCFPRTRLHRCRCGRLFVRVDLRQKFQFTAPPPPPPPPVFRKVHFLPLQSPMKEQKSVHSDANEIWQDGASDDQRRLTPSDWRKHLAHFLIERQFGSEIPAAVTSCVLFDSVRGTSRKGEFEQLCCCKQDTF